MALAQIVPGLKMLTAGAAVFSLLLASEMSLADSSQVTASSATAVRVGIQPLGIPSGVISAVMRRDRILQAALKPQGGGVFQPHFRGADIVTLMADNRLEAGLLGDMPTLLSTVQGKAVIVGLVKQTSTAVVGRNIASVAELAGKRIGYVDSSSAHHTLLSALNSVNLKEHQVKLVKLPVADLPDALAHGQIDAFAAWEPAPSVALSENSANRVIYRGLTSDFMVLDRKFIKQCPDQALQLIASFVRAIEWMRRSRSNLEQAALWVKLDSEAFSGKAMTLPVAHVVRITHKEILDIPAAPSIPGRLSTPPLKDEFEFLAGLGKLPPDAKWQFVAEAFRYDGLAQVLKEPHKFQISVFDYAN